MERHLAPYRETELASAFCSPRTSQTLGDVRYNDCDNFLESNIVAVKRTKDKCSYQRADDLSVFVNTIQSSYLHKTKLLVTFDTFSEFVSTALHVEREHLYMINNINLPTSLIFHNINNHYRELLSR